MSRRLSSSIAVCTASALTASAHATSSTDSPDCGIRSACGLHRLLYFLYGASVVLGIIFVIVLAAAAYFYFKNKRSELPRR
jgi:uncharacterized membrane protein